MAKGVDTGDHPNRKVHRERYTGVGGTIPGSIAEGMEIYARKRFMAHHGYDKDVIGHPEFEAAYAESKKPPRYTED